MTNFMQGTIWSFTGDVNDRCSQLPDLTTAIGALVFLLETLKLMIKSGVVFSILTS
jgi:hypothetical protein